MPIKKHGLAIGIERIDQDIFLTLKAQGKLTHGDYEIITPMIDSALEAVKAPTVKTLFDATELEGWETRAAWDDFKIGLKHGRQFKKIAIYGNKQWLKTAAKVGSWFISGDIEYFDNLQDALSWLQTD